MGIVGLTGWTGDGVMRHPVFLRLREDKTAREVVREVDRLRDERQAED